MQSEKVLFTPAKSVAAFTLGFYIFALAVFFVPPGGVLPS
jgi:hypothetical protein